MSIHLLARALRMLFLCSSCMYNGNSEACSLARDKDFASKANGRDHFSCGTYCGKGRGDSLVFKPLIRQAVARRRFAFRPKWTARVSIAFNQRRGIKVPGAGIFQVRPDSRLGRTTARACASPLRHVPTPFSPDNS
jgi:hypothetical protein